MALSAPPPRDMPQGDFARCFSWHPNSGAVGDGWYHSDACEEWARAALGPWLLPGVAVAVLLVVFPLLFVLGRYACDCCGGRKPSKVCCTGVECSHDAVRTRRYSNRAISAVRLSAVAAAIVLLAGYGALAFANGDLHRSIKATLDGVDQTLAAAHGVLSEASAAASTSSRSADLAGDAPALHRVVQRMALLLTAENSDFDRALEPVTSVLADIRTAEDGATDGRSTLTLMAPAASVLTAVVVAALVAMTVRAALPFFVVVVCWVGLGAVGTFAAHMLIGVFLSSACGAYDETLGSIAVGALSHSGVCENTAVTEGLFDFADRYEAEAWALPSTSAAALSPVCDAMRTVCGRVACSLDTCGGDTGNNLPFVQNGTFNVNAFRSVITAPFVGGGGATITSCARGSACPVALRVDTSAVEATRLLLRFDNATMAMVRTTLGELLPAVRHCNFARVAVGGPVHRHICGHGGVQQSAMWVAYVAAGMAFVVLVGVIVVILAIKRAVPLDRARPWHDPHADLVLGGDDDDRRFDDLESSLMGTTNNGGAYAGDPLLAARRRVHELTRALAEAEAEVSRAGDADRQEMARLAGERDEALADAAAKADHVTVVEGLRAAAERNVAAEAQSRRAAEARAEEESHKAAAVTAELEAVKAELARAQERAAALTRELAEAREVSAADFVYDAGGEAP